ncbi:TolC family protein [Puniceicoccales bacterium CK1056]|uniref:TolC family protein n=1 Tax=Oceanipulchritudo coccoides TaxID=2706888 RepID=A0A6B2M1M9_9BACT|nr:TolC family protein [Oceanipulchritudo coccoides]NDV61987.1 TolC family protein [Oceanipulchritudo coccoides]
MNRYNISIITAFLATAPLLSAETLQLTMEEAIAQALERNFAIRVERFEPAIARQQSRAASGIFDPVIESEYFYQEESLAGFDASDESASARFGVGSLLPWGMEWEAAIEASDRSTPFDPFTGTVSDSVSSFAGITVTQPILRNFGLDGTYSTLRIAREAANGSWEGFRARVMDTVESTISAYQTMYFAQQNLRIAERNRDLALQLLEDNRRRVETGVMAPLDIVQAESEAALREVSVISSEAFLQQAENALKGLVWDNPATILELDLEIAPPKEPDFFKPELGRDFQLALQNLPEYLAAESGLNIRELELRQFRRNALPQLDIVGSIGRLGIDQTLSDSLDQSLNDGETRYTIGAVFSFPFPNRSRSAEKVQAYLKRNQADLQLVQLEQSIRIQLDDAATQLEADWARIGAARKARELSEKSLEAEEKKLRAGTSSTFVVLRLQGDLAVAEIREINALTDYAISAARYNRVRGSILDVYSIQLDEEK